MEAVAMSETFLGRVSPWLKWAIPVAVLTLLLLPGLTLAQDSTAPNAAAATVGETTAAAAAEAPAEEAPKVSDEMFAVNNTWMMVATGLVFLMHLGFAALEAGLCRRKNCVNVLTKNTAIPMIGVLTYCAIGFSLMYPGEGWTVGNWIGSFVPGIRTDEAGVTQAYNAGYTYWTDFLFQAMFCATACTIVSGAMAERVKLMPFLAFATIFTAFCYPIVGSWKWGNGWLNNMETPFYDFAGSTLVHSVGGWAALIGILLLGPRLGKYTSEGRVQPIPGHSMPLATAGMFMLFLGWYGFNGGSVLSANPGLTSLVLVTTTLAGAAGTIAALITSNITGGGKPDLSMALNGALAGLVGITAGADLMSPLAAILIGLIAGVLVVFSVLFFDKMKIDDPVGALSVHLVCGIWGTLAVGIFGSKAGGAQLVSQLIGVAAAAVATIVGALIIFGALKAVVGIRVSEAEELEGLDIGEHGMEAYAGFAGDAFGASDAAPMARAMPGKAVVATA
jgi:ammonium transporter, Amt family